MPGGTAPFTGGPAPLAGPGQGGFLGGALPALGGGGVRSSFFFSTLLLPAGLASLVAGLRRRKAQRGAATGAGQGMPAAADTRRPGGIRPL